LPRFAKRYLPSLSTIRADPLSHDFVQPQAGLRHRTAIDEINRFSRENLPASVHTAFQGSAQAFQSFAASMGFLLLVTIIVIYMVLGILYESFIHPLTILSSLPLAGFGALAALAICGLELDMYAYVGIIMLVGIVKKNGIMMVDFALEAEKTQGLNSVESIYQASLIRFRPIMMTTMAALFGCLPIGLGFGSGRRGPTNARRRRGRRTFLFPDPHPLRHTGLLHLPGPTQPEIPGWQKPGAGSR